MEKNNLQKTLNIFKSESKKVSTHYGQSKSAQLSNIHKFSLSNANVGEVREYFQRTDGNVLKKAVSKLKKSKNTNNLNPEVLNITKLPFFKKLLEKEEGRTNMDLEESMVSSIEDSRVYYNPLEESRQYEN